MPQQDKRFLVKIYASDGTTLRKSLTTQKPDDLTLPHVKNAITFRSRINGGLGECVLDLAYPWMVFGEGTTIAHNNVVDIVAIDEDNPRGRRIYRGFISKYEPYIDAGSNTGVKVTCLGLVSLLMLSYYKSGSAYAVTHTGQDPETIFRAIIDHFNTIYSGSLLSYSGASTDPVGTTVTVTYTDQRWGDAIGKTHKLAGTNWWWKVDADGLCHFLAKPSTATHMFTIGKNIESINAPKDGEKIVNDVQVRGESGATSDVSDSTSISSYGKRTKIVSDTGLGDSNARTQRGNKEVNDFKDPKIKSPFVVNAEYDLESIKVGDTCRILNYDKSSSFFSTNMLIVAITYAADTVRIEVEEENANLGTEIRSLIGETNTASGVSSGSGGGSVTTTAYTYVDKETPSGTINSSNVTFTIAGTPLTDSLYIWLGGSLQKDGGADYSLSGTTITFINPPETGSVLLASYRTSTTASTLVDKETPSGSINGSNVTFTLGHTPVAGSEHVYLNGALQDDGGVDYSISSGTITFTVAPETGAVLLVSYRY